MKVFIFENPPDNDVVIIKGFGYNSIKDVKERNKVVEEISDLLIRKCISADIFDRVIKKLKQGGYIR